MHLPTQAEPTARGVRRSWYGVDAGIVPFQPEFARVEEEEPVEEGSESGEEGFESVEEGFGLPSWSNGQAGTARPIRIHGVCGDVSAKRRVGSASRERRA